MKNLLNTTQIIENKLNLAFNHLDELLKDIKKLQKDDEVNPVNNFIYEQMVYSTGGLQEKLAEITSERLTNICNMHMFKEFFTKFYILSHLAYLKKGDTNNVKAESSSDFTGIVITNPITKQTLKIESDFRKSCLDFILDNPTDEENNEEYLASIQVLYQSKKLYLKTWEDAHLDSIAEDIDAEKLFNELLNILENKPSDFIKLFNKDDKLTDSIYSKDIILENLIKLSGSEIMDIKFTDSEDMIDDIYKETKIFFDKFKKDVRDWMNNWAYVTNNEINFNDLLKVTVEPDKIIITDISDASNDNFRSPSKTTIKREDDEFFINCYYESEYEKLSELNCSKFINRFIQLLKVATTKENWQQLIKDNFRWYDYLNSNLFVDYIDMIIDFTNR